MVGCGDYGMLNAMMKKCFNLTNLNTSNMSIDIYIKFICIKNGHFKPLPKEIVTFMRLEYIRFY